ncbi:MAG TPA: hypothetical protein VKT99_24840 [Xanthobacteraceae bacterium]|jgi:hypothetical protein|nr:hypothetical protein [Xanthobacteraceae bacterium]
MSSFPLFTSIKPPADAGELAHLRDCLESWRAAGFDAVAVNGPKETERLRKFDLGIEFAPLPNDGKPRIGAIFSAIRRSGVRFAGIINSDCKIVRYPNLVANLGAALDRTLLLGWRIDLGPDHKPTTRRGGFDAFFFDANILPPDDGGFSIAEPWWDHWFPLACEMHGARIETLAAPLLTHRDHPEKWSEQDFVRAGRRFWSLLQCWHRRGDMPKSLREKIPAGLQFGSNTLSLEQLGRLTAAAPIWLFQCRPQAVAIMTPEADELETILRFGGHFIYHKLYDEAELAYVRAELAHARAGLAQMRNSTSWRMTAPLRRTVIAAREIATRSRIRWVQLRQWSRPSDRALASSGR